MPPKLCLFLARLGVLCRTLDAARVPTRDERGVREAKEGVVGAAVRTGLV